MAISFKGVLICGLVAGVIINVSGIAMVPLVGEQMEMALRDRNLPPMGGGAMAYFGIMSLVLGVFLVWMYAAVSPWLGQGRKTAAVVSVIVWFMTYFWSNASMVAFGFLPMTLTAIGTAWGLVELVLAGQVGAYLYSKRFSV